MLDGSDGAPARRLSTRTSPRCGRTSRPSVRRGSSWPGPLEQRSELRLLSAAVPGAAVTVVRLHASLSVLEQRSRLREPGSPEGEIDGARWWAEHLERARPEDHLVETADRPVGDVAREVLRLAGWLT